MSNVERNYGCPFNECLQAYLSDVSFRKNHVAQKIIDLLELQSEIHMEEMSESEIIRDKSNCHQTSRYVLGLQPDIGVLGENDEESGLNLNAWNKGYQFDSIEEIYNAGYGKFIEKEIEQGYPINCIICSGKNVNHSIVLLGKDSNGSFGFEQGHKGGQWKFIYLYKTRYKGTRYYKSFS